MLTFNDFVANAHLNFMRAVASSVGQSINPTYGSCSAVPRPGSANLKYEGVDVENKQLVVDVRLHVMEEFNLVVEILGTHDGESIFRTVSYRPDALFPENVANLVLAYYRRHT